jgi:hypothetical protein
MGCPSQAAFLYCDLTVTETRRIMYYYVPQFSHTEF